VASAVKMLGFCGRTHGYWAHDLNMIVVPAMRRWYHIPLMHKGGQKHYLNALAEKEKRK